MFSSVWKTVGMKRSVLPILLVPLFASAATGDDIRTHDPSAIVRDGNRYWVFHTGPGCRTEFSTDLKTWQRGEPVFPKPLSWWQRDLPESRLDVWAPDVIRIGSEFFLYYSVSVFGKKTSLIGLARNRTLHPGSPDFQWRDEGAVIETGVPDNFNAIDPAACFDERGRLWLIFGSYWTGIKAVELDPKSGKRIARDSAIHPLAAARPPSTAIEAAYVYRQDTNFFLFVNWGQCCQGTNSTYVVGVGRSGAITGPYLDRKGENLLHGGGSVFLKSQGRFIGPGHIGIFREKDVEWCSYHFYDGEDKGRPKLRIRKLGWDEQGWPRIEREAD